MGAALDVPGRRGHEVLDRCRHRAAGVRRREDRRRVDDLEVERERSAGLAGLVGDGDDDVMVTRCPLGMLEVDVRPVLLAHRRVELAALGVGADEVAVVEAVLRGVAAARPEVVRHVGCERDRIRAPGARRGLVRRRPEVEAPLGQVLVGPAEIQHAADVDRDVDLAVRDGPQLPERGMRELDDRTQADAADEARTGDAVQQELASAPA